MKPTILVIDDQPGTRRLLRNVLEADGYAVVEASDESSAWIAVQSHSVMLALVDVDLPGVCGRNVADRLQMLRPVQVVLMSGHDHGRLLVEGRVEAGAPFLAKPFKLGEVRETVGRELH